MPFNQVFRTLSFFFFLILLIPLDLIGQNDRERQQIDSLELLLSLDIADTTRFRIVTKLSRIMNGQDADKSFFYARQALALADQISETVCFVEAWYLFTRIYVYEGKLDSFSYAREKTLSYLANCDSKRCRLIYFDLQIDYAFMYNDQGQPQKAIELFNALLKEPDIEDDTKGAVYIYLGQSYGEVGDYDASLAVAEKIFVLNQLLKDDVNEIFRLKIIYDVYEGLNQKNKLQDIADQILAHCRKMDQEYFLKLALDLMIKTHIVNNESKDAIPYLKELLSICDENANRQSYIDALINLLKAIPVGDSGRVEYATKIRSILDSGQTFRTIHMRKDMYEALSNYYLQENKLDSALYYAQSHLRYVQTHQQDTAELVVYALENLSRTQIALGQYKEACHTYDTLYGMRIELMSRTQEEELAKTAVEMELAENESARQKAEQATLLEQQTSATRSRFFMILLILAGLILAGVGWAYRRAQRDKQLISEKNQLVEQSLAEKEVLLREIHHRVKNNLQIISSLLDKQARKSSDTAVRKLVKEGQERIQSMALIHQNLYESEQLSGIDIKSYLVELTDNIQRSQAMVNNEIEIELNVEDEKLDIDTAIPVGLILNELLTNSYKYAFAGQIGGKIKVDFKKQEEQYFLQVSDDGVGFTAEQAAAKTKSLGLNLVNGLVRQLEGTLEWLNVPQGAAVAIKF